LDTFLNNFENLNVFEWHNYRGFRKIKKMICQSRKSSESVLQGIQFLHFAIVIRENSAQFLICFPGNPMLITCPETMDVS